MNLNKRRLNKAITLITNGEYFEAVERMMPWMNKFDRIKLLNSMLEYSHYNLYKESLKTHNKKMIDFIEDIKKSSKDDIKKYIREMKIEETNQTDFFYKTFCEVRRLIAEDLLIGNYRSSVIALGYMMTDSTGKNFIKKVSIKSLLILWPDQKMAEVLYA